MIKITDKTFCCGCFACANACLKRCITMVEGSEDFHYLEVNESVCIGCGLCEKVCPVINVKPKGPKLQKAFVALLHLDQYIASDERYADIAPYDVSPAGFINLVKNAEYICTDSFHGTVFSIIYSKDFFTFRRFNKKVSLSTNTRIYSLLNRLGLEKRLFTAGEDVNSDFHICNYDEIQKGVDSFRVESIKYLTNALNV